MSEQPNAKDNIEMEAGIEVDAVELKTIEIRINEIKDATQRSRFVFVVLTIVASTVLIALFNGILSWDRDMAFPEKPSDSSGQVVEKSADNDLIQKNQETVRQEWLKDLTISVGLLGIRISGTDLAVVGGFTFIVIMVWFFFSQRRENRAIVGLLRYCYRAYTNKELGKDICSLVYEAIVQSIVFIDMGGGDKPEAGLEAADQQPQSDRFIRTILIVLRFLPPITIFLIVTSDIASLLMPSYLRDPNVKLWQVLFDGSHHIEVLKVILFDSFGILAGIYTGLLCLRSKEFSQATAKTINEFKDKCCGK